MRVLLPYLALYRRHSGRMLLGLLLAIITLLASIGLLALSGWFLAASALAGLAGLYSFNYMLPAAGVRGAAIFRTAGRYAERLVSHDATFRVLAHLRVDTFARLLPLSPAGLARFRQADLLNRLVADVDTLDHLYLRVLSPLAAALAVIVVVCAALGWLDITLALTLAVILLALLLLLPLLFYRAGQPIGRALTGLRADYRIQLTAWLQGQAELALYGAAGRFRATLTETEQQWQRQQQRQATLTGLAQALLLAATGLTVTLMFWLAAGQLGESSAQVALVLFTTLAAFEALGPVATAFQHLGHVIASAERLHAVTHQPPEVRFPAAGVTPAGAPTLAMADVRFSYPGQPQPVLDGLNLTVAAGEHIALLGRTGCGKSTLLQLLTRAWDAPAGQIRLGGHALAEYDEATLRRQVTLIPQRVHIFNTTLRDNLRLAAPTVDDAQLAEVLRQVGLGALLEGSGLNGWLGEGGRPLSGGEQRRIGIARALLHNAPLVLLDEPTEGLDAETERQILALLRRHCAGKTLVMVTHRLHGLQEMDRICVMENGSIIEQGHHAELLAAGGRYAHFMRRLG
ncbi:cysteine/glutathione ABC transporter ATP-binding protein/permease CydC [Nissabacter sp. SGAir0207]|uniref:heme ABC transporter ATP-binding protein/permease CydC n=1 Tax=Nissabacter sp. SGAir0207 TaxID=2126321 RepID=UPI0010CCD58D|nr:cysteine/glutathione ABC transporter ATP-binding protein/permease CydC [Nissabacter sp. SGAir0207]QCR36573.1 cysteine/glutathione ABC transporter ATP-binding protein/permease CydC [Nissabacter sp. SGAir0207]